MLNKFKLFYLELVLRLIFKDQDCSYQFKGYSYAEEIDDKDINVLLCSSKTNSMFAYS